LAGVELLADFRILRILLFRFVVIRPIIAVNSNVWESKYEENEGGSMGHGIGRSRWTIGSFLPPSTSCL